MYFTSYTILSRIKSLLIEHYNVKLLDFNKFVNQLKKQNQS